MFKIELYTTLALSFQQQQKTLDLSYCEHSLPSSSRRCNLVKESPIRKRVHAIFAINDCKWYMILVKIVIINYKIVILPCQIGGCFQWQRSYFHKREQCLNNEKMKRCCECDIDHVLWRGTTKAKKICGQKLRWCKI